MSRSVLIVGTLDTKGDQVKYLKEHIEGRGMGTLIMDAGVLSPPSIPPDFTREQVAEAAGTTIENLIDMMDPKSSMDVQAQGACKIIKDLCSKDEINGMVVVGGSMGTALALELIKVVPMGVPKLIISTVAYSSAVMPDMVGGHDVMMLPWTAGLWGINDISRRVLEMGAGAISGAAHAFDKKEVISKRIIGATSLGGTASRYMDLIKPALEARGYEVAVYHTTGMSGRMYERSIYDGFLSASLDLSVGVEFLNEVAGSAFGAGQHRLEAAGKMGIPQIVSTGAIEVLQWGPEKPMPDGFEDNLIVWHNTILAQLRSTPELCAAVGKTMAKQLNKATGPTAVVLPMLSLYPKDPPSMPQGGPQKPPPRSPLPKGFSLQLMTALRDALMQDIKSDIRVVELDSSFNEPKFADTVMELFDEMMS